MCYRINIKLVISLIGEAYPEDERGQARLGGYDATTYQWVGFCFLCVYVYTQNHQRMVFLDEDEEKQIMYVQINNYMWPTSVVFFFTIV